MWRYISVWQFTRIGNPWNADQTRSAYLERPGDRWEWWLQKHRANHCKSIKNRAGRTQNRFGCPNRSSSDLWPVPVRYRILSAAKDLVGTVILVNCHTDICSRFECFKSEGKIRRESIKTTLILPWISKKTDQCWFLTFFNGILMIFLL